MVTRSRLRRRLLDASVYLAWLGGMSAFAFFHYLELHRPSSPDPGTGQTAAMYNHGYVFYVRPWQKLAFNLGLTGCLMAAALLGLLRVRLYGDADFQRPSRIRTVVPVLLVFALWAYMGWYPASK